MKLHHTEYKKNYKKYILDTIETGSVKWKEKKVFHLRMENIFHLGS